MKNNTRKAKNYTKNETGYAGSTGAYIGANMNPHAKEQKPVSRRCASCSTSTKEAETVGVSRNYILGTLCRDQSALSAFGEQLFGSTSTGTLCVSKGLLFYSMLIEGEYALINNLPVEGNVGRSEVLEVSTGFLPTALRGNWAAMVRSEIPEGKVLPVRQVRRMWHSFIFSAFQADVSTYGPGFTAPSGKIVADVSRGLLLYTLYREGELAVHGGFSTAKSNPISGITSLGIGFLPAEIGREWQKTASKIFAANPSATEHEVMVAWRDFVAGTVGTNAGKYLEIFSTLLSKDGLEKNYGGGNIPETGRVGSPVHGI